MRRRTKLFNYHHQELRDGDRPEGRVVAAAVVLGSGLDGPSLLVYAEFSLLLHLEGRHDNNDDLIHRISNHFPRKRTTGEPVQESRRERPTY